MQLRICHLGVCGSLLLGLVSTTADAGVSLLITDNDATPTSTTVATGKSFPISVKLESDTSSANDGVLGIDYFLNASTAGLFTLVSRNSTTVSSAFPSTISTDGTVANSLLNPQNNTDLGGTVNDVTMPVSAGTFEVADFVISVAATTPAGLYTIALTDGGAGFANASFLPESYASLGSFSVTVTPEPSAMLLLSGLPLLAARRRRLN
jgi:hypothetical protein